MASNLPPGVSESDIPGNRPEDVAYEEFWEHLNRKFKEKHGVYPPAHSDETIDLVEIARQMAYNEGYNDGKMDALMDQGEA